MPARIDLPTEELVARYGAGETVQKLAPEYGVCQFTIRKRLLEAGIVPRGRGGPPGNKHGAKSTGPFCGGGEWYPYSVARSGKRASIHRAYWEARFGDVPNGCVIHHIDGNVENYTIENLECLTRSEHRLRHARAE